jgi:hypothetical protein
MSGDVRGCGRGDGGRRSGRADDGTMVGWRGKCVSTYADLGTECRAWAQGWAGIEHGEAKCPRHTHRPRQLYSRRTVYL